MMVTPVDSRISLRGPALTAITAALSASGIPIAERVAASLLGIVDRLHSYTEEGVRLYPELVITTSLVALLGPLPLNRTIRVGSAPIEEVFVRALKSCAPLARAGWVIFIELVGDQANYGVVSAESTELSPTIYAHLVGDLAPASSLIPVIYVRGVGAHQVELRTLATRLRVALSLGDITEDEDHVARFASIVVADVPEERRVIVQSFVRRVLEDSIRHSHGCLLAAVDCTPGARDAFRTYASDGVYLDVPIGIPDLLKASDEARDREASTAVRAYAEVIKGMVGFDGITLLSSSAELIGYNIFVTQSMSSAPIVGGARQRALTALHDSGCVRACLAVSHDGAMTLKEQGK